MDQRRQSSRIRGIAPPPLPPLPRSIRRCRSPPLPPPRPAGAVPLLVPNIPIPSVDGEQPTLPLDVILEIAARSDAASIVRCAATSKPVRVAILGQGFRRLLAQRPARFDPDLLRGVSYKVDDRRGYPARRVVKSAEPALVGFTQIVDLKVEYDFEPVACRDGLVVLLRWFRDMYSLFRPTPSGPEHRVFNGNTGHTSNIPPTDITNHSKHALVSVGDCGGSFELLVVEGTPHSTLQLYSSRDGRWGPVRALHPATLPFRPLDCSEPVVIGRTAHWLCAPFCVVAVHADTAQATRIELPCARRISEYPFSGNGSLILGASPDGKLMAVVSETMVISMWTLEGEPSRSGLLGSWSQRVLVEKKDWVFGIAHSLLRFESFGERSGIVVFRVGRIYLVQLSLVTKKVTIVFQALGNITGVIVSQVCLHEVSLPSLLHRVHMHLCPV